jgi:hypothetical protein
VFGNDFQGFLQERQYFPASPASKVTLALVAQDSVVQSDTVFRKGRKNEHKFNVIETASRNPQPLQEFASFFPILCFGQRILMCVLLAAKCEPSTRKYTRQFLPLELKKKKSKREKHEQEEVEEKWL